jgi:hypothetical protein
MNALDFLVDFAALVSIPDASRTPAVSKKEDYTPSYERSTTLSASTLVADPFLSQHYDNEALLKDRVQNYFPMAPSLSQQSFPPTTTRPPMPRIYSYDPLEVWMTTTRGYQPLQTFDQHLQQNPSLGLPYEIPCGPADQPCPCEYYPPWTSCYEDPSLYNRQPSYETRHSDKWPGLLPEEASMHHGQCRDELCECRFAVPREHYTMNEPWKAEQPLSFLRAMDGHDQWALIDAKEMQSRIR